MISLIDIQNAITLKLKQRFLDHKIYVEENKSKIDTPAFFVDVMPLITTGYMKHKNRLLNVDIMYLSIKETHEENLVMIEQLEELFNINLEVKDRRLYIKNLNIKEVNKVLHCTFTLDYNVTIGDVTTVTIPGTGETVKDPITGEEVIDVETGEPIIKPGTEETEEVMVDKDLGYTEGNIEYMKTLCVEGLEGSDI